jgi:hypothetical protein
MINLNWEEAYDCGDDMFPILCVKNVNGEGVAPIIRWLNSNLEAFLLGLLDNISG